MMSPPPIYPHLALSMLTIKDLTVTIDGKEILHNLGCTIPLGVVCALMGPNGSGKSTLANVIAGHPSYEVVSGEIIWKGKNVIPMNPEERAQHGIFLAFQYPPSLPGISVSHFLRMSLNSLEKSRAESPTKLAPFLKELRASMALLSIPWSFAQRSVNEGFSGGEKKRMEMLQMLILKPDLIILDEIDSGLDIDAIKIVANTVKNMRSKERTIIAITHYQRLLTYLIPDVVQVIKDGILIRSGDASLVSTLEQDGYTEM